MSMLTSLCGMALLAASVLLTLIFLQAAWHKAGDFGRFLGDLAAYRVLPERLLEPAAWLLVVIEGLTVLLLAWPDLRALGGVLAAVLLLLYAGVIAQALLHGQREIDCGCGGPAQPLSWWLVARNLLLTALAGLCALAGAAPLALADSAMAVLAGLLLWGAYLLAAQLGANVARQQRLRLALQSRS